METENWKQIEGFEYWVSDRGRVRSKFRMRKLCPDKDGYLKVGIWKNSKQFHFRVHRLVAGAFIPNPDGLPEINHKDEDKSNNVVDNLEWSSTQYNCEYSKSKHYRMKSPEGEVINIFNMAKFCRDNGLTKQHMLSVANESMNQHGNPILQHKGWTKA